MEELIEKVDYSISVIDNCLLAETEYKRVNSIKEIRSTLEDCKAALSQQEAEPAAPQGDPTWSGWACQYPGKMPRLYGNKWFAEMNWDPENGDRLMFLSSPPEPIVRKVPQSVDKGVNRYGLDMGYFRSLFDRELNRPLDDYTPAELARVLARASRTADPEVMREPEFMSGKVLVDKDALGQAVNDFFAYHDNGDGTFNFDHCNANDVDLLVEAIAKEPARFHNDGNSESNWIEHENNSCPLCGGSGHKDDADLSGNVLMGAEVIASMERAKLAHEELDIIFKAIQAAKGE